MRCRAATGQPPALWRKLARPAHSASCTSALHQSKDSAHAHGARHWHPSIPLSTLTRTAAPHSSSTAHRGVRQCSPLGGLHSHHLLGAEGARVDPLGGCPLDAPVIHNYICTQLQLHSYTITWPGLRSGDKAVRSCGLVAAVLGLRVLYLYVQRCAVKLLAT